MDFANELMVNYPLDTAVEWISRNLDPEDVFSESKLAGWADAHDYELKEP